MYYTHLPTRGLLALSGEDVISFLQGLVSNDTRLLEKGEAVYAALLTPQGKFLHDFFLIPREGKILLDGEKARLDDLCKRLTLYKLRSKVTIEKLPDAFGVVALWGEGAPAGGAFADPRLPALGFRWVGDVSQFSAADAQGASEAGYDRHRLELGVPDGSRDMIVEKSFLLECGFEELHGLDFKKGCYVGQEVTARTHYRGQVKKAMFMVRGSLSAPGTPIMSGEAQAGEMRSSAGDIGLAILRIAEVEKSLKGEMPLCAGDRVIEAAWPGYVDKNATIFAKNTVE
jgi:folate-binding protein YgfZ